MRKVQVCIQAQVVATIEVDDDESVKDVEKREVDVYVHGPLHNSNPHMGKVDLGSDKTNIIVLGKRW